MVTHEFEYFPPANRIESQKGPDLEAPAFDDELPMAGS